VIRASFVTLQKASQIELNGNTIGFTLRNWYESICLLNQSELIIRSSTRRWSLVWCHTSHAPQT